VRHKNFLAVRSTLATKLFLARPTFAPALRQIWGQVADLQQVHFAYANGQHTYSLQEYADLQVGGRVAGLQAYTYAWAWLVCCDSTATGEQDFSLKTE
jgi:hypothetical protein